MAGATLFPAAPTPENRIALYLNFDMIGSPNHVFFIYDGDDSDAVGVGPAGGVFTGAEAIKTAAEAPGAATAGIAYDPCYHLACDTFDNVNLAHSTSTRMP